MSVALADMHAEVKLGLVGRGDVETLIDATLNASQLLFASKLRIRELEIASTAVLNPASLTPNILAQPSDFWAPVILINTSKQRQEIKFKPLDLILVQPTTSPGDPTRVAIRGATFILDPTPKDADVVELTYRFKPAPMTSVVGMTLPDEFKRAVVLDTLAHVMHLVQEEDRAKLFKDQRNDALAMIGDQRGEEFIAQVEGVRLQWSGMESGGPTFGIGRY